MALILCIETATNSCSITLSEDGTSLATEESSVKNAHSSVITRLIEAVISSAGKTFHEIDAIAVGEGPGSYTGLRIGVATAKGLCYAIEKPLIAIGTLQSLAGGMQQIFSSRPESGTKLPPLFCPMIDARRMEVYCALYDEHGHEVLKPTAEIITEESFSAYRNTHFLVFAGDGAMKCKPLLDHLPNRVFLEDVAASANFMTALAEEKFALHQFEDLAYFEPFYLKDFVAAKPRVKGLR